MSTKPLPARECPADGCDGLQIIWLVAWTSVPRVGYESRGVAEVEICGANPDFEHLSDLIAKWLWYLLSQVVVLLLIPKVLCRECVKEVEQAKARGPLYQAKIRKQLIPLVFVGRLFMVGAAAWVAYEIAKANE